MSPAINWFAAGWCGSYGLTALERGEWLSVFVMIAACAANIAFARSDPLPPPVSEE